MHAFRSLPLIVAMALSLGGCAHQALFGALDAAPVAGGGRAGAGEERAQAGSAVSTLLEGIDLFDGGDYAGAIEKLRALRSQAPQRALRVAALKYSAFSYCLTENYARCREAFDQALAIDADFHLLDTELDHPMWGPVFDQAAAAHERDHPLVSRGLERGRWRNVDLWRAKGMSP